MYPDPRRHHPRFEYPGSAGAGPRHRPTSPRAHTHIHTQTPVHMCTLTQIYQPKSVQTYTATQTCTHTYTDVHIIHPYRPTSAYRHMDSHMHTTSMSIHATHPHTNPLYTAHTCSHPYVQHPCLHSPLHIYTLTVLRTRRQPCTYTHPQPHTNPYLDTQAHMAIDHT